MKEPYLLQKITTNRPDPSYNVFFFQTTVRQKKVQRTDFPVQKKPRHTGTDNLQTPTSEDLEGQVLYAFRDSLGHLGDDTEGSSRLQGSVLQKEDVKPPKDTNKRCIWVSRKQHSSQTLLIMMIRSTLDLWRFRLKKVYNFHKFKYSYW